MQIVDEGQHRALSFVVFANRGGNRPSERELMEWMTAPRPKPGRKGPLIKPARPAKYRTVGGIYDNPTIRGFFDAASPLSNIDLARGSLSSLAQVSEEWKKKTSSLSSALAGIQGVFGRRELVEPEEPAEYGPDIPAESFVGHLVRLRWLEKDEQGGLGLTPLGRALLRSEDASESESDAYDVVVLDAQDELSYPNLVKRIAEAGDALLIDPYLRAEQLLSVRAWTSVSRVLISRNLAREDRVAMAVLVQSGSAERALELRMANHGVLHDRMVIGDDLAFTIGTSMNTVGKQHPTILTPLPKVVEDAMRSHVEKWWDEAEVLAASPPVEDEGELDDSE